MAALFVGSATATGAAAGLGLGLLWRVASGPVVSPMAAFGAVVLAVMADVVHARTGRLRPASTVRQVPQAWGRLFDARTAATLYGARLGVGPLTRLSSWMWWPAVVIAASTGPVSSAAVGGVFGAARILTVVAVSSQVRGHTPRRMETLRRRERAVAPLLSAGSVIACVVVFLGA